MNSTYQKFIARLRKHPALVTIVVIFFILIALYGTGFRIGPGASISRVGTLSLQNVPSGASIYADEKLKKVTTATSTTSIELLRGSHSIIISVPGDYPWSTIVSIASGKSTAANPIFITMRPNVTLLTGEARTAAIAAIASTKLPSTANPIHVSACTNIYVDNNRVIAGVATSTLPTSCTPPPYLCTDGVCDPTIVFEPIIPLSSVSAFPGRSDALVISFNRTLYAISLDPRSPRFFAPILTGTNPVVGSLPDGSIVVQNNDAVYKVML
jgi:hypothetical protein